MSKLIGTAIELLVSEVVIIKTDCNIFRRDTHLRFNQFVHAHAQRRLVAGGLHSIQWNRI
ncbi:MAG: hypothetical protein AUG75_12380 [Cyanobacteria bacterium 13_1_20CM_4_61_6]|nr:MAG: hypothetical protein AUG75_12380 [Cyanobacteria bacterium 13_1_20CM_4_61_6]